MTGKEEPENGPAWDGGWEANRRARLAAWSKTTPQQRLAWLEAAIEFVRQAGVDPRKQPGRVAR